MIGKLPSYPRVHWSWNLPSVVSELGIRFYLSEECVILTQNSWALLVLEDLYYTTIVEHYICLTRDLTNFVFMKGCWATTLVVFQQVETSTFFTSRSVSGSGGQRPKLRDNTAALVACLVELTRRYKYEFRSRKVQLEAVCREELLKSCVVVVVARRVELGWRKLLESLMLWIPVNEGVVVDFGNVYRIVMVQWLLFNDALGRRGKWSYISSLNIIRS